MTDLIERTPLEKWAAEHERDIIGHLRLIKSLIMRRRAAFADTGTGSLQDKINSMGTNAAKQLAALQLLEQAANAIDPGSVTPFDVPGVDLVPNEDGTVTLQPTA